MGLSDLLGTSFTCGCGRVHDVPIRRLAYEPGVVDALPDLLCQCDAATAGARVAVVADARTWDVAGQRASAALERARPVASQVIVPDTQSGTPVCDEVTCRALVSTLREIEPALVVAVGSGVINDLCKWSAFELGLPYAVLATAASMNGYGAANVAAQIDGVKTLIRARPPVAVLAEPDVIENAPQEMMTAGFGDTIAKYQSNADWIMNHLLFDEYYCDFCAGIIADLEPLYLTRPEDIRERDTRAIKGLFEALFWTGAAMTLVGTSAPASGGEHLLSHTLDMMAEAHGHAHDLHGRQVGLGTILSAALYERLLRIESPQWAEFAPGIDERFWTVPTVVEAVAKQYATKRESMARVRKALAQRDQWDRLRARLALAVKPPEMIRRWLCDAGGATAFADIGCPRARFRSAVTHMHEIRERFTVVDLAWLVGILPDAADDLIDQWLTGVP